MGSKKGCKPKKRKKLLGSDGRFKSRKLTECKLESKVESKVEFTKPTVESKVESRVEFKKSASSKSESEFVDDFTTEIKSTPEICELEWTDACLPQRYGGKSRTTNWRIEKKKIELRSKNNLITSFFDSTRQNNPSDSD
eukprot:Pgem_evm1s12244